MPIDPYIARGVTPIGEGIGQTVMALEQMRYQRAEDARRNKLAEEARDLALAREQRQTRRENRTDMYARFDREEKQRQEELKHKYARVSWALESENPKQSIMGDPAALAEFNKALAEHGQKFEDLNDEQVKTGLRAAQARFGSELGVMPEQKPGAITTQPLPGGGYAVLVDGKYQTAHWDPNNPNTPLRPTADIQNYEYGEMIRKKYGEQAYANWQRQTGPQMRPQMNPFTMQWEYPPPPPANYYGPPGAAPPGTPGTVPGAAPGAAPPAPGEPPAQEPKVAMKPSKKQPADLSKLPNGTKIEQGGRIYMIWNGQPVPST
jgi:hypothetical protein